VPLPFRIVACCLLPLLSLPPVAFANPQGAALRHGQVRIDGGAGRLQIRQMTQRAVIDWESFSIDQGELTRFIQPGASSAVLNRVRGSSASQIEGMLRANGRVYLINPNGILIGPNGSVDVAGFVASTLDPGDRPFLRGGSMRFSGSSDAAVINLGSISALDGDVVLMGASVLNAGEIRAPRGTAALAAGNDILLAESGEERVFVRGAGGASKTEGVTNTGNIEANIAELKAHGGNLYGMAVKNEGRVAATGVTRSGGRIFLSAGGGRVRSSGSLEAKRSDGSGGRIKVDSGTTGKTEVGGTVDASGATGSGGEIAILGKEIEVFDGTLILNDGETTGGTTRIGGGRRGEDPAFANAETLTVGSDVVISANALGIGDGGEVILFSNGSLVFNGSISAHAGDGGGDGGFVELSGKRSVTLPSLTERLDLSAPKGTPGTLLYDPIDIAILAGNPQGDLSGSPVSQNTLYAGDIADFLTSVGSLIVTTDDLYGEDWGDITMEGTANITWSSGNHLTLLADNDFIMDPGAIIYSMGAGSFAVTAARSIVVGNGAAVTTTNGNLELSANQQPGATGGNFTGVSVNGGTVQTLGSGILKVAGRGGDFGPDNAGVRVAAGGRIIGGTSGIQFVTGRGGSSEGSGNIGVEVNGTDSRISTNGANLRVTGFGGGTGATSGSNSGVLVTSNGIITSGSGSGIDVEGHGGSGGGLNNKGIWVSQSGSNAGSIVSGGGYLDLLGIGGGSGSSTNNQGIQIAGSNTLVSGSGAPLVLTATAGANSAVSALSLSGTVSTGNQAIHLISDGTEILSGAAINSGNAVTTFRPLTNGFAVNVGGSDVAGTTLGLTDAELDTITAGTLQIGNGSSGPITVSAAITHGNHLSLVSGQGITFNQSVTMAANRNFFAEATGTIGFSGTGSLAASGTGSIGLSTARNLSLSGGSGITVVDGALTLEANSAGTTTGSFQGIDLDNALLQSLGTGGISLSGRGGITGNQQYGVILRNGADILGGTDGLVSITGFGGNSAGIDHYGIYLTGNGTSLTSSGADVALTGTGGNGSASSGIGIIGASVTAGDTGSLALQGTGGATTGGAFLHGVYLYEAFINSAGGDVTVTGFAGSGSSATGDYTGVHLDYTTISSGGTGRVTVAGTAGTAALSQTLIGVDVRFESQIRSSGGNVIVTGIGGATTNPGIGNGSGVRLIADGTITAGGTGAVSVTGTGGTGTTIGHEGIVINGSGFDSNLARIGAGNGETTITAIAGNTASHALVVGTNHAGRITSGNNNAITIHADSIHVGSAGIIASGAGNTTILTRTAGTRIDLGGNDVLAGAPLTLGLTDAELDRISAGTLLVGDNQTGPITFSNPITHANNLSLLTGQGIAFDAGLTMATDRDLMVGAAGAIVFSSNGSITSSGTGDVAIDGGRGVRLEPNSFINTVDGTVFVYGNPDGTGTGHFEGIYLGNGAAINTISGQISLTGRGGDGTSGGNRGVHLDNTSVIGSQLGSIEITGFGRGAPGLGSTQEGVLIKGNITTAGNGAITIAGTGGNATSGNPGVQLFDNVLVSTVNGNLSITGTSGPGSSSPGIQVADYGSGPTVITSTAGNISLSGNGSAGEAEGILAFGSGVSIGGGTGNVDFAATGALSLTSNASIGAIGSGAVSLTSNRSISLGAGTGVTTVNGNLTLTANQELYPTSGNFSGIDLDDADLSATGTGTLTLTGRGGDDEGGQHGILLRGGSSLTTNARNLTLSGAATGPFSSGLRIELASLAAGGGTILLTGNGGTTSIHSTSSSATIGGATDTLLVRSVSGAVEIVGQVRGADLQVQDFSGSESIDFLLTNTANDVDRVNAFSNGSNGRVGSLDFRDADGFLVTEFLWAGGIMASGNVSLSSNFFSGAPVAIDRPVRSAGGDILLRGRDVFIDGTAVTAAGSGTLTVESGRAILVRGDSLLSVTGGEMSLEANRDEVSRQGLFTGITVLGSRLQSLGTGRIRLSGAGGAGGAEGTGPDFAFPGFTHPSSIGIRLDGGTVISSSDSSTNDFGIELYGSGGRGASDSVGVSIAGVDTILSSAGRSILVEGLGGGGSDAQRNRGILFSGGLIQAANTGNVTLYGSGGDGVNENDGIQLNGGASVQVAGGDLTLDGYAGETLGIGVMLGNTAGDLSVTGTGSATVMGSGTNANGVVLGNSSAVIGGVSAGYVDLFSRQGNVTLQREALAGGNVFINADFGNTLVEGEVLSGTGDIEIEGDNVTIEAPVTATDGDVTVTFGDNIESGKSESEGPLDIPLTFDGTLRVNALPTSGGRVRYVGGNGNGDLLTFAGHTASGIDLDSADLSLIENVIGTGSTDDRLRGPAAASSYQFTGPGAFNVDGVAYAAFENVLGGGGDDVFAFTANASIGGRLDAGGGTNTLDYSGYGTGVIVDLPLGAATGIVGGFENIANFSGSGNIDTVTGPGSASIYTFSGIDSMKVGTVSVSGFENLIAGPLEDQFIFLPGSLMRGFLDGGASTTPVNNLLDYSLFGTPVTVDLGNSTAGNLPGGFTGINRFRGSASIRDLFTGPNVPTQYLFSAANTFGTSAFEASGFENLTGGTDTDIFLFAPNTGLTGNLSGGDGPGSDLLSYALFGRPVTVNIGPNTAPGIGGRFSGIERITGSSGNDRFNFLNQSTIDFVDGGGGTDLIEINDSNLRGDNTYDISANSVSRNPLYTFSNVEAVRLFLGTGNNTINSGFLPFTQFLHGGNGFNTLNLPGVTTLNGPSPIGNVYHFGFDAPRPGGTDTGGLLQLEVNRNNGGPDVNTGQDSLTENRFSIIDPATLNSQIGALGGAFSAAIVAQSVIATVDGNSYLVLRPFSLDGSGLSPSNLGLAALNESLGVDANLELAAAIGFDGPVFLFNPDGPYSLDLSGVPADPAILTLLQESLNIAAAAELSAALGLTLTVSIIGADGIVPTGLDGSVPGQNVILLFGDQLGAPAEAELNAAISGGN
jgi:filamentous hemagglutinin family protein